MCEIRTATPDDARTNLDGLIELVRDAVASQASVGFLSTLTSDENRAYWRDSIAEMESGKRLLLLAAPAGGRVAGCVQLSLTVKANGRHRASVEKLLVHTRHRGRGLARRLMSALELAAGQAGVTLLVLDTEAGSVADRIYPKLGYRRIGEIPCYAASPDGTLHPTAFYFKELQA